MLVLTRKPGEKVVIGDGITITVVEVVGNRVRLGIEAPEHIRILRGELATWLEEPVDTGRASKTVAVPVLPNKRALRQPAAL